MKYLINNTDEFIGAVYKHKSLQCARNYDNDISMLHISLKEEADIRTYTMMNGRKLWILTSTEISF
jgi:hypothetical protein